MLPPVFDAAGGAGPDFVDGLRKQLGGKRCPDDEAFALALSTQPLYSTAEKNARLRLILERLESSFQHKEPADLSNATIEHVLPQTLTDAWQKELGEGAPEHWSRLLHTLGNLTLTGYNSELSNEPYDVKRTLLIESHFELNRDFVKAQSMDSRCNPRTWRCPRPACGQDRCDVGRLPSTNETEKQSGLPPTKIRFRGTHQAVATWRDAFITLLKQFEATVPGLLLRIATEQTLHAVIALEGDRFRRSSVQVGTVFINTHATRLSCRNGAERLPR